MSNGSKHGMEDRGSTHSGPTALGLGISAPKPRTQISEFDLGLGGGTKMFFFLRDQTTGDLKSHHLQARATLTATRQQVDIVDPDQTAPHEAVWSRSTDLLCYINLLHLFNVRYINYVNT